MGAAGDPFERRLRQIVVRILPHLKIGGGVPEIELKMAEDRHGFALPEILRIFYRCVGNREDVTVAYNQFFFPAELMLDGNVLMFCDDHHGHVHWGIDLSAPENLDPPVVQAASETLLVWQPFQERLSDFLIAMTVWQAVLGGMAEGKMGVTTREAIAGEVSEWDSVPELATWGLEGYIRLGRACIFAETTSGYNSALTAYAAGATLEDVEEIGKAFGIAWNE
jgi:hypothetical protein